jgi:hypothetical protein
MSKSALRRAFAKLAVAIDRRRRWDQFPTPVSFAGSVALCVIGCVLGVSA